MQSDKKKERLTGMEVAEALGIDEDAVLELVDEYGLPEKEDKNGDPYYTIEGVVEWVMDRLYGMVEKRDEEDEE